MDNPMTHSAEIGRIVAALRDLSDELVERVRQGCEDGSAAYACGAVDVLADRLERVIPPAVGREGSESDKWDLPVGTPAYDSKGNRVGVLGEPRPPAQG